MPRVNALSGEPSPLLTTSEDGRTARRERNRNDVVDALLGLYGEGNLDPSSEQIAERAALSARSLFRYFDDLGDLARAAIERQMKRIGDLAQIRTDPSWPLALRLQYLVSGRMAFHAAMGPIGQVARIRAPFQPVIAIELNEGRARWRDQFSVIVAPELAAMTSARAASVSAAADVLLSFESYQLLRHDQGLASAECIFALTATLATLLSEEITCSRCEP